MEIFFQRGDKKWNCKRKRKDFKKKKQMVSKWFGLEVLGGFCFILVLYQLSENGSQSQQVYSFISNPLQLY